MASPLVTALMVVLGLALCAGGFLFFKEAFYLLGLLAGLSVGLVAFSRSLLPGQWGLLALVIAPLVGLALAAWIRTVALAVIGALAGGAIGVVVAGISVPPVTNLFDPILAVCVVVGVVGAYVAETVVLMVASASWGAALLSAGFGVPLFDSGLSLQNGLVNLLPTIYWVLFALGLATQLVVWYLLRTRLDDGQSLKGVVVRKTGRGLGSHRN